MIILSYTVIGTIEGYRLLVLMLNGFLLKFIVKKNPAFPDKGRYVLSSDNETYLCCPCFIQAYFLLLCTSVGFFCLVGFLFLVSEKNRKKASSPVLLASVFVFFFFFKASVFVFRI